MDLQPEYDPRSQKAPPAWIAGAVASPAIAALAPVALQLSDVQSIVAGIVALGYIVMAGLVQIQHSKIAAQMAMQPTGGGKP